MAHMVCDVFGRVTKEETHARKDMLSTIRLQYWIRPPYGDETIRKAQDEFDSAVVDSTPLSEAYALLTEEQRSRVRHSIENPAVRVLGADGKQWWIEESLDLLGRLESGEFVGPVGQTQIVRKVGDKVF